MELEKHHLANIIVIHDPGRNHQWMLKLVGESVMRIGYLQSLKVPSCKFLINHKGEESNLILEKPDTHHPSQVIEDNIANNGTNPTLYPSG